MAKARGDFVDILIRNGTVGPDQLEEAERLASSTGIKLQEALIKLNYATQNEVMAAVAEFHNLQFVNLEEVEIPKAVIELVPDLSEQPMPVSAAGLGRDAHLDVPLDHLYGGSARGGSASLLPGAVPAGRRAPLRNRSS